MLAPSAVVTFVWLPVGDVAGELGAVCGAPSDSRVRAAAAAATFVPLGTSACCCGSCCGLTVSGTFRIEHEALVAPLAHSDEEVASIVRLVRATAASAAPGDTENFRFC